MKLRTTCMILAFFISSRICGMPGETQKKKENEHQKKDLYVRQLLHQMPNVDRKTANEIPLEFRSGKRFNAALGHGFLFGSKIVFENLEVLNDHELSKREQRNTTLDNEAKKAKQQYMICAHEMGHYRVRRLTDMVYGGTASIVTYLAHHGISRLLSSQISCPYLAHIKNVYNIDILDYFSGVAAVMVSRFLTPLVTFAYNYWDEWQADQFALQQARNRKDIETFRDYFGQYADNITSCGYISWLKSLFDCHPHPKKRADLCQRYLDEKDRK